MVILGPICENRRPRAPAHGTSSHEVTVKAFFVRAGLALAIVGAASLSATVQAAPLKRAPLVVTTRGSSNAVTKPLSRDIRRQLVEALGPLTSSRALHRVAVRMAPSAGDRAQPGTLARAARSVGARHLLDLNTYRAQGQWMLQVRLIRASDGRVLRKPRYPYKSMSDVARGWHVKQIVAMTLETLGKKPRPTRRRTEIRRPPPARRPAPPPPPRTQSSTTAPARPAAGPSPDLVVPSLEDSEDFGENSSP